MTAMQAFVQKKDSATTPYGHTVGPLVACLIIGVLLAACGGSVTPPNRAVNAPAAGQSAVAMPTANRDNMLALAAGQGDAPRQNAALGTPQGKQPGTEEFGLTEEELVKKSETVEGLIASCMSDAGFEYVPVDYATIRKAMDADKTAPGLTTEEYAATFGYGISTQPPSGVDSPAIIGLGEQNRRIFSSLSEADQVAYQHVLFGENSGATFAVSLEAEDFSETGGCTRIAIVQVFSPQEMSAAYRNPEDLRIEQDPRVIAANAAWTDCMRQAGFDYTSPEVIEPDLRARRDAVLNGADPKALSATAQAALTELQGEERAIAVADLRCDNKFVEPAVHQVETELYGAPQP